MDTTTLTRDEKRILIGTILADFISNPKNHTFEMEGVPQTLRSHQIEALKDTAEYLIENESHGYIHHPPGAGKTLTYLFISRAIHEYNRTHPEQAPLRIVVVTPTIDLITQSANRSGQLIPDLPYGLYYKDAKDLSQTETFITYNSLTDLYQAGQLSPNLGDIYFFDEAHTSLSNLRREIAEPLIQSGVCLGFTASPDFDLYDEDDPELDEVKAVSILLGDEIHGVTLQTLINNGAACSVANIIVRVEPEKMPDGPSLRYDRGIEILKTLTALDLYLKYRDHETGDTPILGQQGFAKHRTIQHAQETARTFNESAELQEALAAIGKAHVTPVAVIQGTMRPSERKPIYDRFNSGDILILSFVDVLGMGVDYPHAEFLFNLEESESLVDVLQRGGRITRAHKPLPDKVGRVFDLFVYEPGRRPLFYADAIGSVRLGQLGLREVAVPAGPKKETTKLDKPDSLFDIFSAEEELNTLDVSGEGVETLPLPNGTYHIMHSVQAVHRLQRIRDFNFIRLPESQHRRWLNLRQANEEMGRIANAENNGQIVSIIKNWRAEVGKTFQLKNDLEMMEDIPAAQLAGFFRNGAKATYYIDSRLLPALAEELDIDLMLPADKKHWLTPFPLLRQLGMGAGKKQLDAVETIAKRLLDNGSESVITRRKRGKVVYYMDPALTRTTLSREAITDQLEPDDFGFKKKVSHKRSGRSPW